MQELHRGIRVGAEVVTRGRRWTVVGIQRFARGSLVTLDGRRADTAGQRTTLITPIDTLTAPHPQALPRRKRWALLTGVAAAAARVRPEGALWSAVDARFDLHAWQLVPALAVVAGATRVLLADEVGLGKTVQAALILAELRQRGCVDRALVLAPPALRVVWADELSRRFGIDALIVDPGSATELVRQAAAGANPWGHAGVMVSSIDLVKRAEVSAAVEAEPLDLLIVDEAHHLGPGTDRGAVVARLGRRVPWLVLVSATPHTGDAAAFRWLLDLGRLSPGAPAMRVFRRSHAQAGRLARRRCHQLAVRPTEPEAELHDALLPYVRGLARAGGPDGALSLVAAVLARRVTSSAWAACRTLQRRLTALSAQPAAPPVAEHPSLPWEELDTGDDLDAGTHLHRPGIGDREDECRRLAALVRLAERAAVAPSKFRRLRRLLLSCDEAVVVFTEFRDTLGACRRWLEAATSVACLHGGLDLDARGRALARFLDGDARVLLATDVAGEGLNLHTRARVVVTLEWPWSPQRLEQRIGRVDRLGQTRRVHAIHLTARGTFEDTVVARLVAKAARAATDLASGSPPPLEPALVAALAGAPLPDVNHESSSTRVEADDGRREAARVAAQRTLAATGLAVPRSGWAPPHRASRPREAVVVFEQTTRTAAGRVVSSTLIPVAVELDEALRRRDAWRRVCRHLGGDPRVHQVALDATYAARAGHGESLKDDPWREARERLDAISQGFATSRPAAAVQPSLFDRRAQRAAERHQALRARADRHLRNRRLWLEPGGELVDLRVVAVWPVGPGSRR